MNKVDLTQKRLKALLSYNRETGVFTWRINRQCVKEGSIAGSMCQGYVRIRIDGHLYLAHRLAWLYVYGSFPCSGLDHANRTKADNRISNLRLCTQSENCVNRGMQKNNTSGYKGVSWYKPTGKWVANIRSKGTLYNLGYYLNPEDAALIYNQKATELYGAFANLNEIS